MGKLATFKTTQQISLDDALAEFRDDPPPEGEKGGQRGPENRTALGTEPHLDGDCPYVAQCESRRRKLSTYREHQPCHWRAFWQWWRCPIFKNGGIT